MFTYIYEWVENLAFYLVLTTAVIQVIPNTNYKKYVRFFTGLLLILLLTTPILKVFGMEHSFSNLNHNVKFQQELQKIQSTTAYLEGVNICDYIPEQHLEEFQTTQ
ncbi:MAG: stage III sporulation protein AF [Lachnospiraceae bacterium]